MLNTLHKVITNKMFIFIFSHVSSMAQERENTNDVMETWFAEDESH